MLDKKITHLDPKLIQVSLEERQRQLDLDCGDIIPSIRKHGVLFPILVEKDSNRIIAGWRRLTSALFLNLPTIPVRFAWELTPRDLVELELEENIRRKDLDWRDKARSFYSIHLMYAEEEPEWSVEQTAVAMNFSDKWSYRMIEVGEAVTKKDQSIIGCDTMAQAITILTRRRARATENALNSIMELEHEITNPESDPEAIDGILGDLVGGAGDGSPRSGDPTGADNLVDGHDQQAPAGGGGRPAHRSSADVSRPVSPFVIHAADAHEWLSTYAGPKFNFLHCDLPYGVGLNGQAGQQAFEGGGYESSPDIYWKLVHSLITHWDKFMYPRAHVMFWISMKFYTETIEVFQRELPDSLGLRINPTPLIWHKTDNKGIIPDAQRGPRQIYEAALLMSTGDRHIVRPVSNVYGCPTAKGDDAIHTNEKPEPMLKHFFSMFVDENVRVFDPTAGSGSSIRAAEALGAEAGLGLEFNPEFAQRAQAKLVSARSLRQLSSVVKEAEAMAPPSPVDSEETEV